MSAAEDALLAKAALCGRCTRACPGPDPAVAPRGRAAARGARLAAWSRESRW
jgi:hypothetical protein